MKYRLTEDWLEYKKGDVFTYSKEKWLTQNGSLKEDVTPIELSLLLKTGLLEEVKEEEWPILGDSVWYVDTYGEIEKDMWTGVNKYDQILKERGNVFPNKIAAKEASEQIKTLLLSLKK